jgi:phosphate transport system protein
MPHRHEFEKELKELHNDLLKMGRIIEQSMDDTIVALKEQNIALAKEIIERDDVIDHMESTIEAQCLMIIARQQPIARDLRLITSVLKMITDLERIADHCADICEYIIKLADEPYKKQIEHIPIMADQVKKMVRETIEAYVEKDIEKAKTACAEDDIVDKHFDDIIAELQEMMKQNQAFIYQGTCFMFVAKYLERMADHATNIGEWVVFHVTGQHKGMN